MYERRFSRPRDAATRSHLTAGTGRFTLATQPIATEISYSEQGVQEIMVFGGIRTGVMDEIGTTRASIKDARR